VHALETHNVGPKIVYLHHRPESCHRPDGVLGRALLDKDEFREIVVGNVDLVAFGHDSHPFVPSDGEALPQVDVQTRFSNMDACVASSELPYWSEISIERGFLSAVYRVDAAA
jgi:hypothetical protein